MKQLDVLTIGGATLDLMMYTKDCVVLPNPNKKDLTRQKLIAFEYGAKITSDSVHHTYGGGATNTAVNFAGLGLRSAVLCQLGADTTAYDLIRHLDKHNVETNHIAFEKNGHTGFSVIVNVGTHNEHVIFMYRGANHVMKITKAALNRIKAPWMYVTSLNGPHAKKNLETIFQVQKQQACNLAWNPGNEQLQLGYRGLKKYFKHVSVLILNKDEAIELCMSAGSKTTSIGKLLQTIHSWGPDIVAITNGAKGAHVYDRHKQYQTKALKVKGINTTGAGDAFGSTFVAGLIKTDFDIEHSLAAAIVNSNYVIQEIGAQAGLKSWPQIKALMKKHKLS